MIRRLLIEIDSNRVTCGRCPYLEKSFVPERWYCELFGGCFLGYVSAGKRTKPPRAQACIDAENDAAVVGS
jgi:hypothetical protein